MFKELYCRALYSVFVPFVGLALREMYKKRVDPCRYYNIVSLFHTRYKKSYRKSLKYKFKVTQIKQATCITWLASRKIYFQLAPIGIPWLLRFRHLLIIQAYRRLSFPSIHTPLVCKYSKGDWSFKVFSNHCVSILILMENGLIRCTKWNEEVLLTWSS